MAARFLKRPERQVDRLLFFIIDRHLVHRAKPVAAWLRQPGRNIRFYLPSYRSELNPDELLNHDARSHIGRQRSHEQTELKQRVRWHLHRRQPEIIRNFFQEEHVRYAAM